MNYRQQMNLITGHINKITQLYYDCAKLNGISYNTMMILAALRNTSPCTQKHIAEGWGLPKQSVNTIVKKLHNDGYIEFSQGRNNKEKLLAFTDKGKAFANGILQPVLAMEERILQRIGEKECQQFEKTTEKFATFFSEELCAYAKNKQH